MKLHAALSALMNLSWFLWCTVPALSIESPHASVKLPPLWWHQKNQNDHLNLAWTTPPSLSITQWFLGQSCDLSKSTCHEIWDHTGKPSGRCETARACLWVAGVRKMPTGFAGCWWSQWATSKDLKWGEMNPTSGRLNFLARPFRVAAANQEWESDHQTAHPSVGPGQPHFAQ